MMIFWEARLVLLATPKTGSQALEAALGARADVVLRHPPEVRHMPARRARRHLLPALGGAGWERLELVAVIRDPLDWLASWFRYRRRPELAGRPTSTAGLDFAAFVEGYLSDDPPPFARVGRQARFLDALSGPPGVDHLFAHERPGCLHAFLSRRLATEVAPPRRNVSPPAPADLPAGLRARADAALARDIALHRGALER